MRLPVLVEPSASAPPAVEYRWDADTDILSARVCTVGELPVMLAQATATDGPEGTEPLRAGPSFGVDASLTGAVELEGRDGSWIVLDVEAGHLAGVEIAVWPNVRRLRTLTPPVDVEDARVRVRGRKRRAERGSPGAGSLEVTTHLTAEADPSERTIHFRLGAPRVGRSVRLGKDLLVDIDAQGDLAGLWLLNVPPVPTVT